MRLTTHEQRLVAAVAARGDSLLADLKRHVGIPSGTGFAAGIDEARGLLTTRLAALGARVSLVPGEAKPTWLRGTFETDTPPPTAVCSRLDARPDGPRILIAGHLDTVHDPRGPFQSLSTAPDGRTAVGPGCVDMKGGLVIAVAALEALAEVGAAVRWTYLLNADEETGSLASAAALRAEAARHDVGLALEPALPGGELATARGGSGQFMLTVRGRSAHVGRDFASGVSAVTRLAECLVAIGKMPDVPRGRIACVGPIAGGKATNAVPDHAQAWGNCRYNDAATQRELAEMLTSLATPADAMPGVAVDLVFNRPAKPLTPRTESLALAARAAAEDLGQRLPFAQTGGVCDGNILQDAGLPTIDTLGVRGGGLHTPQEWIELPSLVERCQLLALLMLRLAEGRAGA